MSKETNEGADTKQLIPQKGKAGSSSFHRSGMKKATTYMRPAAAAGKHMLSIGIGRPRSSIATAR